MVSLKRKVRRNFKVVGTEANIALKSQKLNSNNSILDKTQFSKRIETFVNPNNKLNIMAHQFDFLQNKNIIEHNQNSDSLRHFTITNFLNDNSVGRILEEIKRQTRIGVLTIKGYQKEITLDLTNIESIDKVLLENNNDLTILGDKIPVMREIRIMGNNDNDLIKEKFILQLSELEQAQNEIERLRSRERYLEGQAQQNKRDFNKATERADTAEASLAICNTDKAAAVSGFNNALAASQAALSSSSAAQ